MLQTSARRILTAVPTLALVILFSFLLQAATPGDPAKIIAGQYGTPEQIAKIRQQLNLNAPLLSQFGTYFWHALHGNLGVSAETGRSVTSSISEAIPISASLILVALVFSLILSFAGGIVAATHRGSLIDRAITAVAAAGLAIPTFVVGLVLVVVFAIERSWLPATGYVPLRDGFGQWFEHLILPGLALSLASAAELTRQIRSSFSETLDKDFIITASAFGIPHRTLIMKRAARNSAASVITVFGLQVGRILSGAVVVEQVFAIPGFGTLAYNAVVQRDLPIVQGVVLVSAVVVVVVNLLTDLLYPVFNPRLRG